MNKKMITRSSCNKLCGSKHAQLESIQTKEYVKCKKNKIKFPKIDVNTIEEPEHCSVNKTKECAKQQTSKAKQRGKSIQFSKNNVYNPEEQKHYSVNETKIYPQQQISKDKLQNKRRRPSKRMVEIEEFRVYSPNDNKKCVEVKHNSKKIQRNKKLKPSKKKIDPVEDSPGSSANEAKKCAKEHESKIETILNWLEQLEIQNIKNNVDNTVLDTHESSSYTSDLLEELNIRRKSRLGNTGDLRCLRCKHFLDIPKNLLQLPSRRPFSPLAQYNADLSFIQAISWLKSAILSMSNVSSEEFYLIFHKQRVDKNTDGIRKKVKSVYKNLVDATEKQKIMQPNNTSLKSREMATMQCGLKNTLLTPQRNYGNCLIRTKVIEDSDQETPNSVTPTIVEQEGNVLNPRLNKNTCWKSYINNRQNLQNNFNVKLNRLRDCPLISNISCKSSLSVQTCVSNIWNDINVELQQHLPTPGRNNLDVAASQLNTSTFQTSESSLEIIQMLGPAFITQCSKISKVTKSSKSDGGSILKLVEECPTPNSDHNIKPMFDTAPTQISMLRKTVEAAGSPQFDSAYDTYNMYAFDTSVPLEVNNIEMTNRSNFPIQGKCKYAEKIIEVENFINGSLENNRVESSVNDYMNTLPFREKAPALVQTESTVKETAFQSANMSQSLFVQSNRCTMNRENGCINSNIGKIKRDISAKRKKEQVVDEDIGKNNNPEMIARIPTEYLNYALDTFHVDDVLHESADVIMSVFEKDEIAETYMKRKRWKGTLEEEAANAVLNLSDIFEAEKKFGLYNKQIVNVIERVLTNMFDSRSLNKSSLWVYHMQIILQFCNSMRICIEIISFLITKLEAFQSTFSESNYKFFRRFNQLHFIFYGLDIVVQKFQSVRSCKLHENCENVIPPVTDLWKRQWIDSVPHDDIDILQVREKRWMDSLESFAVTYVGEFPEFAEKARRLFLMLIKK